MKIASVRWFAAVLTLAFAASGACAAGKTLSMSEKVDLTAPPAKVWDAIKDFGGWQTWHPAIAGTEITKGKGNSRGSVRVLTTKDGAKITEELTAYTAGTMSYTYRILESPLPVTNYVSTLKVTKSKTGATVVWSSKFKAKDGTADDEAKKVIAGIYRAGLDNLPNVVK
jgi:uncharacterized protein YndB with AHSA1/START domain